MSVPALVGTTSSAHPPWRVLRLFSPDHARSSPGSSRSLSQGALSNKTLKNPCRLLLLLGALLLLGGDGNSK